jgi:hypothetical protein
MFIGSMALFSSDQAAAYVFMSLHGVTDYIPILYRSSRALSENGHTDTFQTMFSVHLFQLALQLPIAPVFLVLLYQGIRGRTPDRLPISKNLLFLVLFAIALLPTVLLIFGPYDISDPSLFSNVFFSCLTVPCFNMLFYFLVYARFWESHFAQNTPSPPSKA